jgi:patatin-like phospholipase/acyl hydrolase
LLLIIEPMAKTFRILSINGGGMRGLIPALILQDLEKRTGKPIHQMFDLIAGTSTGGLIACALSASADNHTRLITTDQIVQIYTHHGQDIFPQHHWFYRNLNKVLSLKRPQYSTNGLNTVLRDLFKTTRISDCLVPLFIPSYDIQHNEAVFFKSRHASTDTAADVMLYDVCRATSAAPTYFSPYPCTYEGKDRTFVDGGLFMNNPSIGAVVEISKYRGDTLYNRADLQFEDICVLSLGTGDYSAGISPTRVEKWGELDWAKPITDIMMQAVNQCTAYEAAELLGDGHFLRMHLQINDAARARIDDSSTATQEYLQAETNKQILNDLGVMTQLDRFIDTAQLLRSK